MGIGDCGLGQIPNHQSPKQIHNINYLNEFILKDKKNILLYGGLIRNYWNNFLQKKSSIKYLKYPIEDSELYMFPDIYNLEKKYYYKPKGNKIYYNFSDLIQIFDFLSTFSHKIYLNKFRIEELYIALKYNKKEINLVSSIHISLLFILIKELSNFSLLEINNNSDRELLMLKICSNYHNKDNNKLYKFIDETWPELIRFIFNSTTINKFMDNKLEEIIKKLSKIKRIIDYNNLFTYEEKIIILKGLIYNCYETNFIRNIIKEEKEKRDKIKKRKKELEENVKEIEQKKRELERQEQYTQPQIKIEELNEKLLILNDDNENMSKYELSKLRKKIGKEIEEFKSVIKEINYFNNERENLMNKIENIRNTIDNIPTICKKYLGSDYRKYKYYYFPWLNNKIYLKNNKGWREIKEEEFQNLIDSLSDKGIKENDLKNKIKRLLSKKNKYDQNSNDFNPIKTKENDKNEYELIYNRLFELEEIITNYLSNDNKEWESFEIRNNIKTWITCINNINEYTNLLKMFNERIKLPYKSNNNYIIISDESPIDNNGHLNYMKSNKSLEYGNKIKLWSKEFESYSLETIYFEYLNKVSNFPMLHFSISFFEVILYDLNKRRDLYKKKNEEILIYLNEDLKEEKELFKEKKKDIDWNEKCLYCNGYGDLICCDDCPNVAHLYCAKLKKEPEIWRCPNCDCKNSIRRIINSFDNSNK